jgi:hypothetical protein
MKKARKIGVVVLVVLNLMVLLGQIWPEGAPPFARTVNILFLCLSLLFFLFVLFEKKAAKQ